MAGGPSPPKSGGRFDFEDGGTFCGGWEDGKAHGHGVCTGPKGKGEYSGSWHFGFEVSGVYTWPSGSAYEGQWQNGKRHGLGVETRGRWLYRGEYTQGFKGRYGVRQCVTSGARYEGTWANGLQDGYGSETYADSGIYQGQWMRGMRHGLGVRTSAPYGVAIQAKVPQPAAGSVQSLSSDNPEHKPEDFRGGFVLKARSDQPPARRRSLVEKSSNLKETILLGLRLKKLRSTGDLERRGMMRGGSGSTLSSAASSESGQVVSASLYGTEDSFVSQDEVLDPTVTETYLGEWKNDRRCGFGVAQRSDGLKYEGEWCNNKKYGYGVTTFRDGTKEEGKYKNNVLVTSGKKRHLFVLRSSKFKERVETAVASAVDASNKALAKAEIALLRTGNSKAKAELADQYAARAREDADLARLVARQFAPEIYPQVVPENVRKKHEKQNSVEMGRPAPQHHAAHLGPALPPPQPHPATTMPIVHSPPANAPISKSNNIAPRPHFDDTIPNSVSNKAPIAPIEPEPHPAPPHTMRRNPSMARSSNEPFQQVVDDHFDHYMRHKGPRVPVKAAPNLRPPMGFSPESTVVIEEVEESPSPCRPARRSTLVVDQPSAHRTASLYMKPSTSRQAPPTRKMGGAGGGPGASFGGATMKRKKSLPDINANKASTSAKVMPREEISVLSSQRREEVRRQQEMEERLRANPFLYVCNPNVKAWISRQKLVILVLLINIALGFLFFRLLA